MNVPGVAVGSMQPAIWDASYNMLLSQGFLKEKIDLTAAYNFDFVKAQTEGEQ